MRQRIIQGYFVISLSMIAVSLVTGHRASRMSGEEHYLFTRTSLDIAESVPATQATDAAFDAAYREGGETPEMNVRRPVFVLGLLDATGPAVVLGGLILGLWSWVARRQEGRRLREAGRKAGGTGIA